MLYRQYSLTEDNISCIRVTGCYYNNKSNNYEKCLVFYEIYSHSCIRRAVLCSVNALICPAVSFPEKTILGFLHRKNCMETQNGFFIKDLRIIQNRSLKDIIMVDNLVHSFGLQIHNGIPILEFLNNKNDK